MAKNYLSVPIIEVGAPVKSKETGEIFSIAEVNKDRTALSLGFAWLRLDGFLFRQLKVGQKVTYKDMWSTSNAKNWGTGTITGIMSRNLTEYVSNADMSAPPIVTKVDSNGLTMYVSWKQIILNV
jgi:hypothetical protein